MARSGTTVSFGLAESASSQRLRLRHYGEWQRIYQHHGLPLRPNQEFEQEDYAASLERIIDGGVAALYHPASVGHRGEDHRRQ